MAIFFTPHFLRIGAGGRLATGSPGLAEGRCPQGRGEVRLERASLHGRGVAVAWGTPPVRNCSRYR